MAWLPPEFAYQMSMATHICAGVTGVMVWDIVTSLGEDYQIFFKRKVGLTNVVYFISRIASMLFMVLTMILVTSPIGNCPSNQKIFLSFFSIAIASSNLLFFFRLRAIYTGHKAVIIFGFILWVISAGGTVSTPVGVDGVHIGTTNYCTETGQRLYVSVSGILPFIHDTFVFLAISYKLAQNAHNESTLRTGLRAALFGEYLPAFSRSLLLDGQQYYLLTVLTNFIAILMVFVPVPIVYRVIWSFPNVMMMNVMACRVYRNTKLGLYKGSPTSTSNILSEPIPLAFRQHTTADNGTDGTVQISRTTQSVDQYDRLTKKERLSKEDFGEVKG